MKNKILSVIVSICLIIACFVPAALAESKFSDVLTPDHDWASAQIEEMSELGIIKGYTDGTFKPDNSISKIEALLLFSRVAGFSNEEYSAIVDFAHSVYENKISKIDLGNYADFDKELAFLIYKGILTEEEITDYLADKEYKEKFPRGDAAILLTSLMHADVKNQAVESLDFADADKISDGVAPYIAYVVKEGLMNGVDKKGTVVFDAEGALSRAQVSVLLHRVIKKLDMKVESGTLMDIENSTLTFKNASDKKVSYEIPSDAKIIINGSASKLENIVAKSEISVVFHGESIYAVEAVSPKVDGEYSGTVVSAKENGDAFILEINLAETNQTQTYPTVSANKLKITTDGVADDFDSIKEGDLVVIKLSDSVIKSIDRQSPEIKVEGVLKRLTLEEDEPVELSVTVTDKETEKTSTENYLASEDVTVIINGEEAEVEDLAEGDKVVLTINRNEITKIVAESVQSTVEGTIAQILIAKQSKITLTTDGVAAEYNLSSDAEIAIGKDAGSIYDLRLGNDIKVTLFGKTITKISQPTTPSSKTKMGTIKKVDADAGVLTVELADGSVELIHPSKSGTTIKATIINGETGKTLAFKNLKKGDFVSATGFNSSGNFVAKTIVVTVAAEEEK